MPFQLPRVLLACCQDSLLRRPRLPQQSPDKRGAMGGWDQMRARLIGTARQGSAGLIDWSTGRPMAYCFSTCADSIRTIPVLQHDPDKPEDLDTKSEDHAADDWRYACSSRPWIPAPSERPKNDKTGYRAVQDDLGDDSIKTL